MRIIVKGKLSNGSIGDTEHSESQTEGEDGAHAGKLTEAHIRQQPEIVIIKNAFILRQCFRS